MKTFCLRLWLCGHQSLYICIYLWFVIILAVFLLLLKLGRNWINWVLTPFVFYSFFLSFFLLFAKVQRAIYFCFHIAIIKYEHWHFRVWVCQFWHFTFFSNVPKRQWKDKTIFSNETGILFICSGLLIQPTLTILSTGVKMGVSDPPRDPLNSDSLACPEIF